MKITIITACFNSSATPRDLETKGLRGNKPRKYKPL